MYPWTSHAVLQNKNNMTDEHQLTKTGCSWNVNFLPFCSHVSIALSHVVTVSNNITIWLHFTLICSSTVTNITAAYKVSLLFSRWISALNCGLPFFIHDDRFPMLVYTHLFDQQVLSPWHHTVYASHAIHVHVWSNGFLQELRHHCYWPCVWNCLYYLCTENTHTWSHMGSQFSCNLKF